nr:TetR/AcrR family transcriptional regulator [Mycobacteroides salmoniphilum]
MATQVERSASTRAALKRAGRELFAEQGYAAVSTQALVDRAGVSRGPLYHQFGDKLGLFKAVFADVENEIAQHVVSATSHLVDDPVGAIRTGMRAFLDIVSSQDILRIAVVEAPAALGWQTWHERGESSGFTMLEHLLTNAIQRGQIPPPTSAPSCTHHCRVGYRSSVFSLQDRRHTARKGRDRRGS